MKVVLNLKSLNELELVNFAGTVIASLTGNAAFIPKPTLADLTALHDGAQAAIAQAAATRQAAVQASTLKD